MPALDVVRSTTMLVRTDARASEHTHTKSNPKSAPARHESLYSLVGAPAQRNFSHHRRAKGRHHGRTPTARPAVRWSIDACHPTTSTTHLFPHPGKRRRQCTGTAK